MSYITSTESLCEDICRRAYRGASVVRVEIAVGRALDAEGRCVAWVASVPRVHPGLWRSVRGELPAVVVARVEGR